MARTSPAEVLLAVKEDRERLVTELRERREEKEREKIARKEAVKAKRKRRMAEYSHRYWEENRERLRQQAKDKYYANREEFSKRAAQLRKENHARHLAWDKKYRLAMSAEQKARERTRMNNGITNLADWYVRHTLMEQIGSEGVVSPEMIKAQRAILKVKRLLKCENQRRRLIVKRDLSHPQRLRRILEEWPSYILK